MLEIRTFSRILELDEYLCWNGLDCSKDLAREKKKSRVKRKVKFQDYNFFEKREKAKEYTRKKKLFGFLVSFCILCYQSQTHDEIG